jgi:hypothetical protein
MFWMSVYYKDYGKLTILWVYPLVQQVAAAGITNTAFVDEPFDYITRELSEIDV